jgi:hypothetical protein
VTVAQLPNQRKATSAWAIRKKHELEGEETMAIYITQGRYTADAVKGMVAKRAALPRTTRCRSGRTRG